VKIGSASLSDTAKDTAGARPAIAAGPVEDRRQGIDHHD
jgi:hypothetical protein